MQSKSLFSRIRSRDCAYKEASLSDIIDQVSQNLDHILNTRQGGCLIADDYGIPDFNSLSHDIKETLPNFENQLKKIINKYEPRINVTNLKSEIDSTDHPGQIIFHVSAYIIYKDDRHYVEYETIMTDSGKILVRR
jgi:type VI secretion system protein